MNILKKSLLMVSTTVALAACATTETVKSIDDVVAEGGVIVEPIDLIGETGVTFVSTDGGWYNYLGTDGRKVVKITESGLVKNLTWRVNDEGQFCQQMFSTEKESCNNNVLIKFEDGTYNSYNKENNKPGNPFTIVEGNPQKF